MDSAIKINEMKFKTTFSIPDDGVYILSCRVRPIVENQENTFFMCAYDIDADTGDPIGGGHINGYQWFNFTIIEPITKGSHYIYTHSDVGIQDMSFRANIIRIR